MTTRKVVSCSVSLNNHNNDNNNNDNNNNINNNDNKAFLLASTCTPHAIKRAWYLRVLPKFSPQHEDLPLFPDNETECRNVHCV